MAAPLLRGVVERIGRKTGTQAKISQIQGVPGCPNEWIVDEGIQDSANAPPPQLTGFQNTNAVRTLDTFESTLFNLVYNTNAVFLEVYEDVLWRAALAKGTSADPVPALSLSTRTPGGLCQYAKPTGALTDELCYSKTLHEWAEELRYRRDVAEGLVNTSAYPAYKRPFPTEHSFTFHSSALPAQVFFFINPSRCDSAQVDLTGVANSNALGKIVLLP